MSKYSDLDKAIALNSQDRMTYADQSEKQFQLSRTWLMKYAAEYDNEIRQALVMGALSAAVEVVAAGYLGLMRSAVFSLRTHFDLAYGWLYYRDHPIEWKAVASGSEQARLPGAIDQYLGKYYSLHKGRWTELEKKASRKIIDPYGRMSAIIHGGYQNTVPKAMKPADIVFPPDIIAQLPSFIYDVSETLSDVFVSCHVGNWHSVPDGVKENLNKRFAGEEKVKLLFD
jgi:hypothetical protein